MYEYAAREAADGFWRWTRPVDESRYGPEDEAETNAWIARMEEIGRESREKQESE
jgi:hypothetical protein